MTRDHAALQLLAHGPLTRTEFREITGWHPRAADQVVARLRYAGLIRTRHDAPRSRYELACNNHGRAQ